MSTGGGLKVTTVFVALVTTLNAAREKDKVEVRKREIAPFAIRRAFAIIMMYFMWVAIATWVLSYTEKGAPLFSLLFEVVSALSTVGLSIDYTPHLTPIGKIIIISTMLVGRIGVLAFLVSFCKEYTKNEVIGVDMDLHRVDMLKNDIAGAVALDSTDKEALSTLPLSEMDAIIVTFGKDFGTSVQTVALLKSLDAGKLIVRAISSIHETVIRAIGVSEIITPEEDFSTMYTSQASLGGLFRHWYKVTDTEHLYKIKTPATLVGQTIKNIDFEENFGIHLVAIERPYEKKNLIGLTQTEYKVISRITEELVIEADDLLILFGKMELLNKIANI